MKHTSFIPMDSCSQEWRDPNILESPPDKLGRNWLMKYLGVFILFFACFALQAQTTGSGSSPITGSGATALIDSVGFMGQAPDFTDPCTCTDDVNGIGIFNDEILIFSERANDVWEIATIDVNRPIYQPNSDDDIDPGTRFRGPIGQAANGQYLFSLPIAHEQGVGYSVTIQAANDITADENNFVGMSAEVSNLCSQVAVEITGTLPDKIDLSANTTLPDLGLRVINRFSNTLLADATTDIRTGVGETGSLYIGNGDNPTKILIRSGFEGMDDFQPNISVDPSGALAVSAFDPSIDTLITFVYDADTSLQAQFTGGTLMSVETDPGCEATANTDINWNTCDNLYEVGNVNQKYDGQERTFIVCPCDPTLEAAQIAFGRFDVARGDTLSIYEGNGTSGTLLERTYKGGASATSVLNQTWFRAACENTSGCLTVVFSPNSNNEDNGTGFSFTSSCESRAAEVTCPSDAIVPAVCDLNNSGVIAGLHQIQGLVGTCNVSPAIDTVIIDTTLNVTTPGSMSLANALVNNMPMMAQGQYSGADDTLDVGENIFLLPGVYTVTIVYEDPNGTTADPNDTCSYNLTIDSGINPVCNDNVNISLSASCQAIITPDQILEGEDDCTTSFIVRLLDGANRDTNFVDSSYLDQTVRVEVIEPNSGNRCWGLITVEDKLGPTIECVADTFIYCGQSSDPEVFGGKPTITDLCSSDVTYNFSDSETNFSCRQGNGNLVPDTLGIIVRTWTATDSRGNRSNPCTQTIYILKPQISSDNILWPSDTALYCGDNPSYAPETTGFPRAVVGTDTIEISQTCLFGINFQDLEFDKNCAGTKKIRRTWTIIDWCRSGAVTTNAPDAQLIEIVDTVGPVITDLPFFNEITITNAGHDCDVDVEIPAITVSDDCSPTDSIQVRIVGPSNTIFGNGGMMRNIPFGTHDIIFIAEDDCGNTSRDTVTITVNDAVSPTVICERNLVVSLTQDGTAWVYANTFDDGSHDNCSIDSMRVRRMDVCSDDPIFVGATDWSESVPFACCDLGGEVMVSLGVWDHAGNFNNCMVNVVVQDKVQPTLVCPPDQTVDCTDNLDDLSIFGDATLTGGNCNAQILGDPTVVRNLNNCGAGAITRTWSLGTQSCTQTITVELTTTDSFRITNLPPAEVIVDCDTIDLSRYDNGDDLTYENIGCQVVAVNYQRTDFTGEANTCRKIIRTWEIIDWCVNPTASADADNNGYPGPGYRRYTQVVRVMDGQGPTIFNSSNNMPVGNLVYNLPVNSITCTFDNLVLNNFFATDNCAEGRIDVTISGQIGDVTLSDAPINTVISGLAVGQYTLFLAAEDGCNNRTVEPITINITDDIGPAMFCTDELAVNLGESFTPAHLGGSIAVWASDFACKVEDCAELINNTILLAYPAEARPHGPTPPARAATSVVFTCADLGRQTVDIWANDANGNWNIVTVQVTVQDNRNLCSNGGGDPTCTTGVNFSLQGGVEQAVVSIADGRAPYTISWNGPASGSVQINNRNAYTISPLPAGSYAVTVRDADGCSSTRNVTVTQAGNPNPICTTGVDFSLQAGAGQVTVNINSGREPYTISWDGPVSSFTRVNNSNTFTINSLPVGNYIVTVTDADGCNSTRTVTVTQPGSCPVSFLPDAAPSAIWIDVQSGPAPYTIEWTGPVSGTFTLTNGTGYNITNLPIGVYVVTVRDANGCASSQTVMVTVSSMPQDCEVPATVTGGVNTVTFNISSGTAPFIVSWTSPNTDGVPFIRSNSLSGSIPNLGADTYAIVISDALGCNSLYENIVVTANACANAGGDADNDGVCANNDCDDNDASVGARQPEGTACDDGNPETTNDAILADGCTCRGGAGGGDMAAISGSITTERGETVENVTVSLEGYTMNPSVTGANGNFRFESVPMYSEYTVRPSKDMNPLNGVSTFDLVLISKHILGLEELDSPYKRIAADVNNSGTITAYDMVNLRQLILNINTEFPNNESWRFVNKDYEFTTASPENEDFSEIATVNLSQYEGAVAQFTGIKVGDVDGNASVSSLSASETRTTNGAIAFNVKEQSFEKGDLVEVDFNLNDLNKVLGYQFTLTVNPEMAEVLEVKEGIATADNFGLMFLDKGQVTTSWNQREGNEEGTMFSLVMRANTAGKVSDLLQLGSELTASEAYSTDYELMDVAINFEAQTEGFNLYQNRPNPFSDVTTIGFDLAQSSSVELSIFDVSGKLIQAIEGDFAKGYNEVQISKADLAGSGIYFYSIETGDYVAKKRMILID